MRYLFAVLGVIAIGILAVVLITQNSGNSNTTKPGAKPTVKLVDYIDKDNSRVVWTLQGKVVGEDQRRAIRITISSDERRIEILDGYEQTVERSKTYENTQAAYDTFLRALNLAGFTLERKVSNTDERGVCPLGNNTIYDLQEGDNQPVHLWSSSCSSALGTAAGGTGLIQRLFQAQIPDYSAEIKLVHLL